MKRFLCILTLLSSLAAPAQIRWIHPFEEGAQVHGQGWSELNQTYFRLPDKAKDVVSKKIWGLSRNAAGLSLVFRSNAPVIYVRYQVKDSLNTYHMPSTGRSGVDLFARDNDGGLRWCGPKFRPIFGDTILYQYNDITYYPQGADSYEYHLYLPLYNTLEWLEIGIPQKSFLTFVPVGDEKPIVVYGTSIVQGACASRPGMAWTSMVECDLRHPVINMGFAGCGKMEPEVFELLAEIDAGIYVIDCMPNMVSQANLIQERLLKGLEILRAKHDCPILIVEHSGYVNEVTNEKRGKSYQKANRMLQEAYKEACAQGIKGLYYLTREEFGLQMNGMVEAVHPSDLGMRQLADGIEQKLRKIIRKNKVYR